MNEIWGTEKKYFLNLKSFYASLKAEENDF